MSTNPRDTHTVIGHHAGWGLFRSRVPVYPFKTTPGATEVFNIRAREKVDIYGVGTDVVQMDGIFVVRRFHPTVPGSGKSQNVGLDACEAEKLAWREAEVKAEFRALELYGESQIFGTVRVRLNTDYVTEAVVSPSDNDSSAKKCNASVNPIIELPEMGLTLNTGGKAVRLASKVIQIPPVGDVARSENSVPLMDDHGKIVGELVSADIEIGEVLLSIPLGATERTGR